jgi:ABC-2 type transport system permease protein
MKYKHVLSKQNRALLAELVRTDFKLRYQGSVLGYAWSLLRPLLLFLILYVVFVRFLKLGSDVPHFPIYLLLGIVIWNFFNEMTVLSLGSIVGRGDLIRKIRIPRWIIVFSSSISALINLGLNLVVVGVFMIVNQVDIMSSGLWLPLILLEVYLLALGLSLFLSALFVKFRDVGYIWEVVLQAGFYMTPILYPLGLVTNQTFQKLLLLNPVAQAVQDARYAVVTHDKSVVTISRVFDGGWYMLIPFAIVALILVGGFAYFRKESKYFAENI